LTLTTIDDIVKTVVLGFRNDSFSYGIQRYLSLIRPVISFRSGTTDKKHKHLSNCSAINTVNTADLYVKLFQFTLSIGL
jgi:hypothetical protein